jgi:EAL domain-containing protein (putative c-di-GMP-specific phosphodiesterase class I)
MKNRIGISRTDDLNKLLQGRLCTMAFQPIVELRNKKIYGFEALLRGSNGTNLQSPGFLFNQEGYLDKECLLRLDTACIGSALRSGRELAKKHRLFINIHFATLHYLSLHIDSFMRLLNELDINPENIVFEISERTDVCCAAEIEIYLREFVRLGMQIAIDDIGASFNWIHHMLRVKPSYLKVDKAVIDNINISRRKQALLKSLNLMANSMAMHLIVEGVESLGQAQLLNETGITFAQGFWLGQPHPIETWMKK